MFGSKPSSRSQVKILLQHVGEWWLEVRSVSSTEVLLLIFSPTFYLTIKCNYRECTETHRHTVTPQPQLCLPSVFTASVRRHDSFWKPGGKSRFLVFLCLFSLHLFLGLSPTQTDVKTAGPPSVSPSATSIHPTQVVVPLCWAKTTNQRRLKEGDGWGHKSELKAVRLTKRLLQQ